MSYPEQDAEVFIAVPYSGFFKSSLISTAVFAVFLACSMAMFCIYGVKCLQPLQIPDDKKMISEIAKRNTLPGLLIVILITVFFCVIFLLLQSMSSTANICMSQHDSIRYETNYIKAQEDIISGEYPERFVRLTNILSRLLSDHPELRTRENLIKFSQILPADYLMIFGKSGEELCSSNSFMGYSVSSNNSDPNAVYLPVLRGYSYMVTEPAMDPITGIYMFSVASLITDPEGLPDGFLLMAVNANDYVAALDQISLENTVNNFIVLDGQLAAMVDEETGRFTTHTDHSVIGKPASDYLSDTVLNRNYDGFTSYDHSNVYLSGRSENGQNILIIDKNDQMSNSIFTYIGLIITIVVILCGIYYPKAVVSCAELVQNCQQKIFLKQWNPLMAFSYGYRFFFTLLAVFAFVMNRSGNWTTFRLVFSNQWSKGVHLFSIWAAVFILSGTLCAVSLFHYILSKIDDQLNSKEKTVTRLIDSSLSYTAAIFLFLHILTMFGTNTASLIASAGILSIAVGLGSQDLVMDILAGIFMIFEGTIHVGDVVTVGSFTGVVTNMGVRTTEITNETNNKLVITNREVNRVINRNKLEDSSAEAK